MQLNNNKYEYISIICNNILATYFEKSSPAISLKYINHAIEISEKSKGKYLLPHLFHFKGRILFEKQDYKNAVLYFNKALSLHTHEKEILYVASMHNNLGMCFSKMGNTDLAVRKTITGINILKQKKDLNHYELYFLHHMKKILAEYYIKKKNFENGEKLLTQVLNYSLNKRSFPMAIECAGKLSEIYKNNPLKVSERRKIIEMLVEIEPKLKKVIPKISLNEVVLKYYTDNNNHEKIKVTSKKIVDLYYSYKKIAKEKSDTKSDIIAGFIVNSINREYEDQKRKSVLLTGFILLLLTIFLLTTVYLIKLKKRKEEMLIIEKEASKNQKLILEQDIELQREKIRNLHLNLNLKTETERAFLENLKKIKKSKNINGEEVLRDLQFKINNLLSIDKKNNDLINESSNENKMFIETLSSEFPVLTEPELKLCVYFKLNLSAKEISLLENFTVGSIRVYKTRIKSKIGLNREDNLSLFLNKI